MYSIHHRWRNGNHLLEKRADEWVFGVDQVVDGAVEDEVAGFKHEEGGVGIGHAIGEGDHAAPLGVVAVGA